MDRADRSGPRTARQARSRRHRAPVQGLSAGPGSKLVNLATQDPEQPTPLLKRAPGILHVAGNVYHDANIDFRNTTIVMIRKPEGGYTITAKPGSAPITGSARQRWRPRDHGKAAEGHEALAVVKSSVAAGSTVTIARRARPSISR